MLRISLLLNSFDLPRYDSESRKRCTLGLPGGDKSLGGMVCLGGPGVGENYELTIKNPGQYGIGYSFEYVFFQQANTCSLLSLFKVISNETRTRRR